MCAKNFESQQLVWHPFIVKINGIVVGIESIKIRDNIFTIKLYII